MIASGSTGGDCNFRGLPRGLYTLKGGGQSVRVLVNGDRTMDLAGKAAIPGSMKKILGVILILVINLAGVAIITRIWKRGE